MESLQQYIQDNEVVNEGFLMNAVTKRTMKNMSSKDLYTGILNMYDYIVDNDDIKLFYQDFPMKERLFWKNLYDLYQKQVWSIFDVDGDSEVLNSVVPTYGSVVKVNSEFRRKLRQLLNNSRNTSLNSFLISLKVLTNLSFMILSISLIISRRVFSALFRSSFCLVKKSYLVDTLSYSSMAPRFTNP